jgi:hypothetical protein
MVGEGVPVGVRVVVGCNVGVSVGLGGAMVVSFAWGVTVILIGSPTHPANILIMMAMIRKLRFFINSPHLQLIH